MYSQLRCYEVTGTIGIASDVLRDIGSEYSLKLEHDLSDRNLLGALTAAFPNPSDYNSSDAFSRDYLAYNLLRKSDFLDVGVDRGQAALTAFLESEETCRMFNQTGRMFSEINAIHDRSLEAKIHLARRLIADLLGPFSWDKARRHFGFSSGASTRLPRRSGDSFYKYQGKPEVTPGAAVLAVCDIWSTPLWRSQMEQQFGDDPTNWVTLVRGSRAATVPKTWKTDRFICIEAECNMRAQRGIGQLIRKALRRVGINLNDQSYNQYLALIGSRTGSLATVDLKSASDSIALRLVEILLPRDWYEAILLTRSDRTQLPDGTWHELEKVSSMGNGYTFELESLIFWALSSAVLRLHSVEDRRLAVYGDDIVIHASVYEPLVELLSYVGFTVNDEKSFAVGPFRESCGKHYFYGADVSPFNIKEVVASENRVYWFLNTLRAWNDRNSNVLKRSWLNQYRKLRRFVSGGQYCIVPPFESDESGLHVYASSANVVYSLRKQGYLYKCLRPVRRRHRPNGPAAVLAWFERHDIMLPEELMTLQKGDVVYKRFTKCTSRWPVSAG